MISAIPLLHSALEFRLQILLKAMCKSNTPIGESVNVAASIPLVLCNKHGLRKRNSIVAYRFFNNLAFEKYSFEDRKFIKHDDNKAREICHSIDLSFFVDHPKVNQKLLQLLFYSLETAVDFYNHIYDIRGIKLSSTSWYQEYDSHYYDMREKFITPLQRKDFKNVMEFKNTSSVMIEAMFYFVQKSTELIRLLDENLKGYYVMYELKP